MLYEQAKERYLTKTRFVQMIQTALLFHMEGLTDDPNPDLIDLDEFINIRRERSPSSPPIEELTNSIPIRRMDNNYNGNRGLNIRRK